MEKVMIMRCDDYDPNKIQLIISKGLKEFGVVPKGNILLKPNVVIAHKVVFPFAFTRSEFLEGAIIATKNNTESGSRIIVGERSGITIPTRYTFKNAGYLEVLKRQQIKAYYFDEQVQVPVALPSGCLREEIFIPLPIAEADFLFNLPKFKGHPWTLMTMALKNVGIGCQDDRHRLVDHNAWLEHKIVDMQTILPKGFIAVDAIIAGQKMMLTPDPFSMGAIVMGTNPVAVDTVCCHMISLAPEKVNHLRMAHERGFGPMSLDEIDIVGDFPLKEIQRKTKNFQLYLKRIEESFQEGGRITCTVGKFPEKHSCDYCWGGCPGALQEASHIIKALDPEAFEKIKKIRYVVGKVEEIPNLQDDESVIFAGNCTSYQGMIGEKYVKIEPGYKKTHDVNVRKTKTNDMLWKMFQTFREYFLFLFMKRRYMHARGCPVSVGDHVHLLSLLGGIKNPNFDSRLVYGVANAYWKMRFFRFVNNVLYKLLPKR